jgi:hypothetical protein
MDISYTVADDSVLDGTDHCTGHVYLFTIYNEMIHVILGHNKKHNNCASFGGFANPNETLRETICREFSEETLDCVMSTSDLITCLSNCMIITRTSSKGKHFTIFCNSGKIFDFSKISSDFVNALQNPNLTQDQQENDYLTMVPLVNIINAFNLNDVSVISGGFQTATDFSNFIVKDYKNNDVKIRDINVPAYKWIIMEKMSWERERDMVKWKSKFIDDVMCKSIILFDSEFGRPVRRDDILKRIEELGYPKLISNNEQIPSYKYLIDTPMCKFSQ